MKSREWTRDQAEVLALARDMHCVGVLASSTDVLDYFHAPYNWSREHEWWMAHDRTDDPDRWDAAGMIR